MKITAIIPLRISQGLYQADERLRRIIETIPPEEFDVLIVDYGTPAEFRGVFDTLEGDHVSVHRCDVEDGIFSIGHARDVGVQHARSDVVMFHDIDFLASAQTYHDISKEVRTRRMPANAYEFFCVPVFFLTEAGSELYLKGLATSPNADRDFHIRLFEGESELIQFAAYGSSAMVVSRYHYLSLGGHSRKFFGHGAEDYDILHRLGTYSAKGPRTADYYTDTKSNQVSEYRGFRAYFALYGLDVFARGIYFVHLWHPTRVFAGYHQSRRNFGLLSHLMRDFDQRRAQPSPLGDPYVTPKSLLLLDETSSSFRAIRHAVPAYGDAHILAETTFSDGMELEDYCNRHNIERVLFLNPYGNPHRLGLYRHVRESSLAFHVFDRGALPDSWFFDDGGFNFDSSTYDRKRWDVPLTEEETSAVREYIETLRRSESTLETNAGRTTPAFVREQLGIGRRKVIFVPFQRPSDTVTTHFAGPAGSVSEFAEWILDLRKSLPKSEWALICKTHPLEAKEAALEGIDIEGIDYAERFHIHDLLELADVVVLMNSGVGVLGLGFGKPVICCSNAFYAHQGLAVAVDQKHQLRESVLRAVAPQQEAVERFYSYLIKHVYSFGPSEYRKIVGEDGAQRSIADHIRFESLRIPGILKLDLGRPRPGVSLAAPLFASFGGRSGIKGTLNAKNLPGKAPPPKSLHVKPTSHGSVRPVVHAKSTLMRKTRKLFRNPSRFFKDFLRKRL